MPGREGVIVVVVVCWGGYLRELKQEEAHGRTKGCRFKWVGDWDGRRYFPVG